MSEPLTSEQRENWRTMLVALLGPYALIASDDEIQTIRDRMQARVEALVEAESNDRR